VTTKRCLGVGDQRVGTADRICIFHGASVPVILREATPKSFQLIGKCYTHRIIDGRFSSKESPPVEYLIHCISLPDSLPFLLAGYVRDFKSFLIRSIAILQIDRNLGAQIILMQYHTDFNTSFFQHETTTPEQKSLCPTQPSQ
jgi:hypothetical protein